MKRTYTELISFKTFEDRFEYLKCNSPIGLSSFGYDRYLNQTFYKSPEWRSFRHRVISRDGGCDLGIEGHDIPKYAVIHHINPITADDVINRSPAIFDLDNVITVSSETHRAIHFGDLTSIQDSTLTERFVNDTCPWKSGDTNE